MAINDENYVTRETANEILRTIEEVKDITMRKRRGPNRRIRTITPAGGAARTWVEITSVTDAANYTGSTYDFPGGSVVATGVPIKVYQATENPLSVGYANFADFIDPNYYLNADLLS